MEQVIEISDKFLNDLEETIEGNAPEDQFIGKNFFICSIQFFIKVCSYFSPALFYKLLVLNFVKGTIKKVLNCFKFYLKVCRYTGFVYLLIHWIAAGITQYKAK